MKEDLFDTIERPEAKDEEVLGGNNFLISAIYVLRRQKKDLQAELHRLKERIEVLESQNAAFLNLSADRLLKRRG